VSVTIWVSSGHGPHPAVEIVSADATERDMVSPLAAFLRTRPAWRGHGRLAVHVGYPRAVRENLVPATTSVAVETLESDAAIVWQPDLERGPSVAMIDWYRDVRRALDDHLRELSRQPRELPFPPS
jgi:hypothetical protein